MQTKHAKTNRTRRLMQAGIILCLMMTAGCAVEEELNNQLSTQKRFFSYDGSVPMTRQILVVLQSKNDTLPFVDNFVEKYGYPMWQDAVDVYEGGDAALYVPVHKAGQEEIEYIWAFHIVNNYVHYSLVNRSLVNKDNEWVFDYMTQEALKVIPKSGRRFKTPKTMTTRSWVRNTTCAYEYYIGSEYNGKYEEVGVNWHCWDTWVYEQKQCDHLDDNDGSGSGPMPGGGGGGGGYLPPDSGDGYTPPSKVTPLSPTLKALFKGVNSLTDADTENLNKAVEEMLQKCFYETINNYLLQNNVQLRDIRINPDYQGQAGVNNLGDLTFRSSDEINTEQLSHEWIHLYQKARNNMTTFGDKRGMMEFEVALVQDIKNFVEFDSFEKFSTWSNQISLSREDQFKYQNWIQRITNNGADYPREIDNSTFQEMSLLFGKYNSAYSPDRGYIYGSNIYDTSTIRILFIQTSNCK